MAWSLFSNANLLLNISFNNKEMNDFDNDTLSDLKFIGKINKGEKVLARYRIVQPDNLMTKISRTLYYKEGRTTTLSFIRRTINDCFNIVLINKNSNDQYKKEIVKNILIDLKKSLIGILNLKDTYCDDTSFCCNLDTICENINARLSDYTEEKKQ